MRMKDEGSKNSAGANEEDGKLNAENGEVANEMGDDVVEPHAALNSNGKSRTKPGRKRRGSSSPEEDIIDGFAISSYASLTALESRGPTKPENINRRHKMAKRTLENGVNGKKRKLEKRRTRLHQEHKQKDSDSEDEAKDRPKREVLKSPAGTTNEYHSDSGSSGRGYLCDAESEDERASDNEDAPAVSTSSSSSFSARNVIPASKASLSDAESEAGKRTSKSSDWPCSAAVTSQRPESRSSLTTTAALPLSLGTSTTASHPVTPTFGPSSHHGLYPHFPPFHSPAAHIGYPHGHPDAPPFAPYPSPEFLRQELNSRFLQAHGDRTPGIPPSHFLHYENHQHLHNHQHQHQHQHSHQHFHGGLGAPGGPLFSPTAQGLMRKSPEECGIFRPKVPLPGPAAVHLKDHLGVPHVPGACLPPSAHSLVQSPQIPRKPGKWCAAHVQIAWQMYYHQRQKLQPDSHKDPHAKPDQVSISRTGPCLSLHSRPGTHDVGFPHPSLVRGQGDVSPVAGPPPPHPGPSPFLPASAIPPSSSNLALTSPFPGNLALGGLSSRPSSMMSLGNSSLGGVGPGFGNPFRSSSGASFRSLGVGSSMGSSYVQSFGHEWGHGSSAPFHAWLSRETERERLLDRDRERERERERERREREKERERSEGGSPPLGSKSRTSSERERPASDEEGEASKHKESERSGSEGRRTPPSSRPYRSGDFNIARLTGEAKCDSSLENLNSIGRSSASGRRDDNKPTESRALDEADVGVLSNERHMSVMTHNHSSTSSFLDRRGPFEDRTRDSHEALARLTGHPPPRVGGFSPCLGAPPIFPSGNPFASAYLSGATASAVSHAAAMPGYLSGRNMLGLPISGLPGTRSRSPMEGTPPMDILKVAETRP